MYVKQDDRWLTQRNIFMINKSGMDISKVHGRISEELSGSYLKPRSSNGYDDQEQSIITVRQQANASPWSSKEQQDKIGDLMSHNPSPRDKVRPVIVSPGRESQNSVFYDQQDYGLQNNKLPYQIQSSINLTANQFQNGNSIQGILKTKQYVSPKNQSKSINKSNKHNLDQIFNEAFQVKINNNQQSEIKRITLNLKIQAAQISVGQFTILNINLFTYSQNLEQTTRFPIFPYQSRPV